MSDLRTRIAAAIYMQEYPKRCESCPVPHPSPWAYEMADAVIRELGRQDCGCVPIFPKADNGGQTKQYGPSPKIATRRTRNEDDDE